jgi:hypothetical protein
MNEMYCFLLMFGWLYSWLARENYCFFYIVVLTGKPGESPDDPPHDSLHSGRLPAPFHPPADHGATPEAGSCATGEVIF